MSEHLIVFSLDVTAYGRTAMSHVFDILAMSHTKVVGYQIREIKKQTCFALCWAEQSDGGVQKFPYEMKIHDALPMVSGWLETAADYGREPDIDGSVKKGWRVLNKHTELGGISDDWHVAAFIMPEWIEFHK